MVPWRGGGCRICKYNVSLLFQQAFRIWEHKWKKLVPECKKKKSDFLNQKHFLKIYICFLSELESIAMGPPKDFLIKVLADSYTGLLPT